MGCLKNAPGNKPWKWEKIIPRLLVNMDYNMDTKTKKSVSIYLMNLGFWRAPKFFGIEKRDVFTTYAYPTSDSFSWPWWTFWWASCSKLRILAWRDARVKMKYHPARPSFLDRTIHPTRCAINNVCCETATRFVSMWTKKPWVTHLIPRRKPFCSDTYVGVHEQVCM
jgi:hypothetical protein